MARIFSCSSCGDPCTLQVGDGAGVPDACPYSDGPGAQHDPWWHGGHSSRKIYRCNRCPGNAAHPKRHPCIIVACPEASPPRNCPWSDFPPQWVEDDSLTEAHA